MILLTEKEARRSLANSDVFKDTFNFNGLIQWLKSKGFVKQSSLDKARELRESLQGSAGNIGAVALDMANFYEKALKEQTGSEL